MKVSAVILAAGMSKRMKSAIPKVLHPLLGRPMIEYPLEAIKNVITEKPVIIIGHGAEAVKQAVGDRAEYALQKELLGTGDAVNAARHLLEGKADLVIVVNADLPLLKPESIKKLVDLQKNNSGPLSLLTFLGNESRGFARIVRSSTDNVVGIVEEKAATPQQLAIKEFNVGIYCFSAQWLWDNLRIFKLSPVGEYYLTDLIRMAADQNLPVKALILQDPVEAMGINNRIHLAEAETILRHRVNEEWMLAGISMLDPERVYIEKSVTIGQDTTTFSRHLFTGKYGNWRRM